VVQPYDFYDWLDTTSYNQQRKQQLCDAYDSLKGARPTLRQCRHIDTFVKSEFYPEWKHARMINSRCDAFKVWSGPRFKAIEDAVYQLPWFIKHVPVPDRPRLVSNLKRYGRKCYATDFTAFESHFDPLILDAIECELYRWCLRNDPDVEYLCQALMGKNEMRTRTGLHASCLGKRMSGDMCTSLGNGFTNLMLAMFIASEKGGTVDGFVEGDDGLLTCDVELTAQDYLQCGFSIKIEEVVDPCCASFCGLIFSESGEIIRDPRKFMMGFGWTQSFINAGQTMMDELLRAKALSAVYETPQCPIIGAFARYALSVTKHVHPRFVDDGFHCVPPDQLRVPEFHPSDDTRELFFRVFDTPIPLQIEIENAVLKGDMDLVSRLLPSTVVQSTYSQNYVIVT